MRREYMIGLNIAETVEYKKVLNTISSLPPGNYLPRDFFKPRPAVPRIARRLYEEVVAGNIEGLSLVGNTSAEGYIKS